MRILFIANPCQNLYKDIESEMVLQGHEVVTIVDKQFKYDPNIKSSRFKYYLFYPLKKILWCKRIWNYWKELFDKNDSLKQTFDTLFVLSGISLDDEVLNYIEQKNPGIKKVIYTWDSCNHYNFDRFLPRMDKSYTFDIVDSHKDCRWKLLPIFYKEDNNQSSLIYDFFLIGSNHDGRYSFVKKILPQLKENGYTYFIKIVGHEKILSGLDRFFLTFRTKKARELNEEVRFSRGEENEDCLSREGFSIDDYKLLLSQSRCVLDDQRDNQSGLSARFIWALSQGKIIYTTNNNARDYSFINPEQVIQIDKENPRITHIPSFNGKSDVSFLRIDNWVKEVLS